MLQSVYSVYDRVRRPLRNHHYLVLPGGKLAYARIPGRPEQIARPVLAALDAGAEDSGWFDEIELLTARELGRRYADITVFAFVQPPTERIAAAYELVIGSGKPLPTFYARHGFQPGMSLGQFVQRVCQISDLRADNLFRSQAHMLERRPAGKSLVLRTDQLGKGWPRLSELLAAAGGLSLPDCPEPAGDADPKPVTRISELETGPLASRLARRYAQDMQLYFADERV